MKLLSPTRPYRVVQTVCASGCFPSLQSRLRHWHRHDLVRPRGLLRLCAHFGADEASLAPRRTLRGWLPLRAPQAPLRVQAHYGAGYPCVPLSAAAAPPGTPRGWLPLCTSARLCHATKHATGLATLACLCAPLPLRLRARHGAGYPRVPLRTDAAAPPSTLRGWLPLRTSVRRCRRASRHAAGLAALACRRARCRGASRRATGLATLARLWALAGSSGTSGAAARCRAPQHPSVPRG